MFSSFMWWYFLGKIYEVWNHIHVKWGLYLICIKQNEILNLIRIFQVASETKRAVDRQTYSPHFALILYTLCKAHIKICYIVIIKLYICLLLIVSCILCHSCGGRPLFSQMFLWNVQSRSIYCRKILQKMGSFYRNIVGTLLRNGFVGKETLWIK